jgi:chromosome segregation ATPase
MIGSFLKHYGKGKIQQGIRGLNDAIVSFDPEGATEAAIQEMQENFDTINIEFSKAKQEWQREDGEAVAIVKLYDKRVAAAEHISGQLDTAKGGTKTQLDTALNQLLGELESMTPDVDREKEEAVDAREIMDELDATVVMYAEKLKTARSQMKSATRNMAKAKAQGERASARADRASVAAGLKESVGGLSSALESMNRQAADAQAQADAANRKADLLGPTKLEDNDAIAAAMAAVSGDTPAPTSAKDRLAALKRA